MVVPMSMKGVVILVGTGDAVYVCVPTVCVCVLWESSYGRKTVIYCER